MLSGKNLLFRICILHVCISTCTTTLAQTYSLKNINVEDGLVQSQVASICQDSSGMMWFGTYGGLSKYDGEQFQNFTTSDGLPDNYISCLLYAQNEIWCGTSKGVSVYDGKKFRNYPSLVGTESNYVAGIAQDHDGDIWCFITDRLYRFIKGKNPVEVALPVPTKKFWRMITDNNGNVWMAALYGSVYRRTGNNWEEYKLPTKDKDPQVYNLALNNNKVSIFSSAGTFEVAAGGKISESTTFNLSTTRSSHIYYALSAADISYLTVDEGLYIAGAKNSIHLNAENGFVTTKPRVIFLDREQNLWIGTESGDGIFLYRKKVFSSLTKANDLPSDNIRWIGKGPSGRIWIATSSNGLCYYRDGKIYQDPKLKTNEFLHNVEHVCSDGTNIWLANSIKGVIKFNGNKFTALPPVMNKFPSKAVFGVFQDSNKDLWVGLAQGVTVYRNDRPFYSLPIKNTTFCFAEIGADSVLAGTISGLALFSKGKNIFSSSHKVLQEASFYCLVKIGNEIWMGTDNNGIITWDYKNDNIKIIDARNGLSSNTVYSLAAAASGVVYAGTGRGVNEITQLRGNYNIDVFGRSDGLFGMETNREAIFKDDSGKIWFGSTKGIYIADPHHVEPITTAPVLSLERIDLFSEPVTGNLKLSQDQNSLTFHFKAITYVKPEQIRYQYFIEGLEKTWCAPTSNNSAVYPSLPHGNFILHLRALRNGIVSGKPLSYSFSIIPAFYNTMWFRITGAILLFVLVAGIIRALNFRRKKRLQEIEMIRKDEERKLRNSMAQDFHDQMGNRLTKIRLLSEVLKRQEYHDPAANTLLNQINENATQLYSGTADLIWSLNTESSNLYDTVKWVQRFAYELFENSETVLQAEEPLESWTGILLTTFQSRNIVMILKEALNNILKHSGASQVIFTAAVKERRIEIGLKDNGCGFDTGNFKEGHGIQNIRKRANNINAGLNVSSVYGKGTSIELTLTV